jgi:hypothetical protein
MLCRSSVDILQLHALSGEHCALNDSNGCLSDSFKNGRFDEARTGGESGLVSGEELPRANKAKTLQSALYKIAAGERYGPRIRVGITGDLADDPVGTTNVGK